MILTGVGAALGGLLGCLHLFGQFHQALRGAGVAVQYHVFYDVEFLGGQVVVGHFGGGVHDAEVHACLYGVVEEHGVHGLADIVVAPEGEREVAHTAAHMGARKVLPYPGAGLDEVGGISVVFFHAGGHGQYVGVDNDVLGWKTGFRGDQPVGALCDGGAALEGGGLSLLVEAHYHHGGAQAPYFACPL